MKNTIKFLGIIGLMLVIGFSMASCDDGSGGPNGGGGSSGPPGGGSGGGGTLTIKDIPSKYNGLLGYAANAGVGIYNTLSSRETPISNGRVTIPLFSNNGTQKYTGNDTVNFEFWIEDPANDMELVCSLEYWPGVQFHNGSATVSFNDGELRRQEW